MPLTNQECESRPGVSWLIQMDGSFYLNGQI